MIDRIHWLGHASFRINGPPHSDGPVIYIDPWRLPPNSPKADIILVSHDHHDHCSPEDIEKIEKKRTMIIASPRAVEVIGERAHAMRPWQVAANLPKGGSIRTVPAYTLDHVYHDRAYEGLGFVISWQRKDIYFAGDTDLIPEMANICCDIALLPVGGAYTMGDEEAVEAVKMLRASIAIPMHFGREIPGSRDNGRRFAQMVNGGAKAVELPIENEKVFV
jgi:L-ascorbate metabolism protein UlaG (beta-lactamase superfamily)